MKFRGTIAGYEQTNLRDFSIHDGRHESVVSQIYFGAQNLRKCLKSNERKKINAQRSKNTFKMPQYIQISTDLKCANRPLCVRANVAQAAVVVQLKYLESVGGRQCDEEKTACGVWTRTRG